MKITKLIPLLLLMVAPLTHAQEHNVVCTGTQKNADFSSGGFGGWVHNAVTFGPAADGSGRMVLKGYRPSESRPLNTTLDLTFSSLSGLSQKTFRGTSDVSQWANTAAYDYYVELNAHEGGKATLYLLINTTKSSSSVYFKDAGSSVDMTCTPSGSSS